jgi:hypothetical protein
MHSRAVDLAALYIIRSYAGLVIQCAHVLYVNIFLIISTFWHECSMKTMHALNIYVKCEYTAM